jgi:hypothetical protein
MGANPARTLAGPWREAQLRVVCGAQLLAVAAVVVAAAGSAYTASFDEQTNWLTLAVAGLALAVVVSASWLLHGRRRLVRRRAGLTTSIAVKFDRPVTQPDVDLAPVASPQMNHYHRENCQLVRGKSVEPASVIEHHHAQRTPCAVCRP